MQRPIMDPQFLSDADSPAPRRSFTREGLRRLAAAAGWCGRKLLSSPARLWRGPADEDRPAVKILRGLVRRALFAPPLLALVTAGLVYCGTHPPAPDGGAVPSAAGCYREALDFDAEDGTPLRGWLAPAVDARLVVAEKENLLRARRPAVVLIHDFGQTPAQVWPLAGPLHDDGFVVLAVALRGVGRGRPAGQTFGLNESGDVAAAVRVLRAKPGVDPDRIALVGIGTGANAALLAASHDPKLTTLVLADPLPDAAHLLPDHWFARPLLPPARWGFELAYRVDADEMRLDNFGRVLQAPGTLRINAATTAGGELPATVVGRAEEFCRRNLRPSERAGATLAGGVGTD